MAKSIKANQEPIAYSLLLAWCLLPAVMSFYSILTALTGRFEPILEESGYVMDMYCMMAMVATYHFAFRVLGVITLLFALYAVFQSRVRAFSRTQMKQNPWLYLLLALLVWCVISSVVSDDFSHAFWGGQYHYTGLGSYFLFGGVFLCATMIRKEQHRKNILLLFCGVLAYISVLFFIQVYADTLIDISLTSDLGAVFIQNNFFGYVLCMGIVGFASLYLLDEKASAALKGAYLTGQAVLLYALLINRTFGAYLAAFVTMPLLYVCYFKSGRNFKPLVFLPALVFLGLSVADSFSLFPADVPMLSLIDEIKGFMRGVSDMATDDPNAVHAGSGRGILWKQTIERICQRPVFGFGPDGFYGENSIYSASGERHIPHNEFLQLAGYTGIPSLLLYLAALLSLTVHHWKNIRKLDSMVIAASCVTLTYLCSSCFGNPIFHTAPYFWLFLGLSTATSESVQPVLYFEGDGMIPQPSKKQLRYGGQIMSALLCVLATMILYAWSLGRSQEYINEYADMQAMRNAELTVQVGTFNGSGDYWYDAITYKLIPIDEPAPAPYGLGTKAFGESLNLFNQAFGTNYDYDERADYMDKVIKVHVEGTGENMEISVEWVKAETVVYK